VSSGEVGIYLYGIAPAFVAGTSLHSEGVQPGGAVEFLVQGSLAAVASPVSLEEFAPEKVETHLKAGEVQWVEEKAFAHATVLQELMQRAPVVPVPVRFGILFRDRDRLLSLLAAKERELVSLLERLAGRMEWGVKAHCREEALKEALVREDHEIRSLHERLQGMPPGTAYLHRRKLEPLLEEKVQERLGKWAEQIHEALAEVCEATAVLEMRGELEGKETVVLHGAYLVPQEYTGRFRDELERLGEEFSCRGLRFVLSGPWPPYHFAQVDLDVDLDIEAP
jgi:hypothetical protein